MESIGEMDVNKRRRVSRGQGRPAAGVWLREIGELGNRSFSYRHRASEDLVLRFQIDRKLKHHRGCVNTISFNSSGGILVSGSDDKLVILWEWQTGNVKLAFHSGHQNNVFNAKIMPYTDDRSIVTCAADGQVRHAQLPESGPVKTSLLAKHQGRAHRLAIEPGSPHVFYSCGEDGLVQHFDLRTKSVTELFTCHPLDDRGSNRPVIQLNAIAIDPRNPNLFAVAGSDELTRLYDIRKYKWDGSTDFGQPASYFCPPHLVGDEQVGITGLAFSDQSELLVSYNDEFIYLFTQDMGLGPDAVKSEVVASLSDTDLRENVNPQVYKGHRNCETVKGVNFFGPKCEYVASGSDCGRIFIWKKQGGELIRVMEADEDVVNCVEPHPHEVVLASSGLEDDVKIWTPKAIEKAILPTNIQQTRPKSRGWMYRISSPEDLLLQLFCMERRRTDSVDNRDDSSSSTTGRDLMELIFTFNGNNPSSSDDGGDASGPEDFFS